MEKKFQKYLTSKEVARLLRTNPTTLGRWRKEERGPEFLRVEGRILYEKNNIDQYLENQRVTL